MYLCFKMGCEMVEILSGLMSGIVSGMGMGGGTVLILILSLFLGMDQHIAQATNLVFFIPTSVTSIIVNAKDKMIDWKIGITVASCGVIGAIIGANIAVNMEVKKLKKLFGIFLALIAIYQTYCLVIQYKCNKKNK